MSINNAKNLHEFGETDRDVYFKDLEEAYGILPVPSDDWADIKQLLEENETDYNVEDLQEAIEIIRSHYLDIAKILGKTPQYG